MRRTLIVATLALCFLAGYVTSAGASAWCGTDAVGTDRKPEAASANQIHVVYAFPSDGTDRFSLDAGLIAQDVASIDAWWRTQDPTRAPRFDLYAFPGCPPGIDQLDLSRVQLPHDTAYYQPLTNRLGRLSTDLSAPPSSLADPAKKYLVYYDGIVDQPRVCGISPVEPFLGGANAFSAIFLGSACPQDLGTDGFLATAAAHELTHNLGALVSPGPLHPCASDIAHACDSDFDLMYPILRHPLPQESLDVGHDDYYAHSGSWFDVQDSSWLLHVGAAQWPLTVSIAGAGTVASALPGIACPAACSIPWDDGSVVTLSEQPGPGVRFAGWSGACSGTGSCDVTMDQAKNVQARFGPATVLTVHLKGSGTVTSTPTGIACPPVCSTEFDPGVVVRLTAKAKRGAKFTGWTSACSGKAACTVRLARSRTVNATFRKG
jgi:hypothetical protein